MRHISIAQMAPIALIAAVTAIPMMAQRTAIQPATPAPATETKAFPLKSGGKLAASTVNSYIKVTAWDRDEVELTAKFKASSDDEHARIEAYSSGDSLELIVKHPKARSGLFRYADGKIKTVNYQSAACNLELKVPRRLDAKIKTVNGTVEFEGIGGDLRVSTVKGAIAFEGLSGDLSASTVNGAINGEIQGVKNRLDLSTELGSIAVKLSNPDGRLKCSNVNGSLKLLTPGAKDIKHSRRKITAKFGDGKADLKFRTLNGSITIM